MRFADRPLLLLILAAIVALGLWGKDYVAAGLPHGVSHADDPNEEAEKLDAGSSASHLTRVNAPTAEPKARGVAPSVSDDSAGTSTTPSAAPITYWGTYKTTAFVLYRSNGPLREFIVKFDLPDIPNREGWR